MTNQDTIQTIIKREFKRCYSEPEHFMRRYCVVQHPIRGKVPFNLYDFQATTLKELVKDQNIIVLKARQIGLSSLVAAYCLWLMLFHKDKNILVVCTKLDTSKNIILKVRIAYQGLPVWLRANLVEDNKLSLRFDNGSQIKAVSTSPDAGRSEALSLLIIDEAAHIDPVSLADEIWTSAASTLATGGKAIILSTPLGMGNFFHRMWVAAKNGQNDFLPIELDWHVHPERDQVWRDEQTKKMGELEARQEHDADFIASGRTVIQGDLIQFHREANSKPPIARRGFDSNLWVWEYCDYNNAYMVVADVARGDGLDSSACHVIELKTCTQVAEYKGKLGTKEFAHLLIAIATEYNDALLVIENGGVGFAVLQEVSNRDYKNLFWMEQDLHFVDPKLLQLSNKFHKIEKQSVMGFTTSVRTRPLAISKVDEYMRDNSVVIRSARTYDELEVFVWNGSKAEAMAGYNDDLVMALAIGLWVRDTALLLRQQGIENTKMMLDKLRRRDYTDAVYTPEAPAGHPFQMPLGGPPGFPGNNFEDFRWVLRD